MYQKQISEHKIMGPTCNFFYILLKQMCIQHSTPKQVIISKRQIYELSSKFIPPIIKCIIIIIIIIIVLCALVKLVFISC
jgi:hypothetical protein